ncbi:MAG: imidazolonepropionase [Bacteroidetes bacterium]|jgi:imidazolonepropionase|nr:imidazolonepropionase [Bacteroidota bacterium]
MQKLLLKNIKTLVSVYENAPEKVSGKEMKNLPCIDNAWLACDDGIISDFGSMDEFPGITDWKDLEVIDCNGKIVMPGFVDSHTHIVYAGNREQEFIDRINGLSYEEIAKRGGGILNSAQKLRETSEDELFEQSKQRLFEVISQGTVAVEIKSGYGLNTESELKILRVIKRLKDLDLIPVKATFLGAHAIPAEFKGNKKGYLDLIINEMLPAIAKEKLADYIDVFCENGYFTAEETKQILLEGKKYGLKGRVHAEQLSHSNGIKAAVECEAISVDHLEFCNDHDIELMKKSDVMSTILPGAAFFLNLQLPPARKMIDAGLPVAFASDYNPGSSPSGNMKLMMSLACIQYKLTPEEAINSVTINTSYALELQSRLGTITSGKMANLVITKEINSYGFLPYAFGSDLIDKVLIKGKVYK